MHPSVWVCVRPRVFHTRRERACPMAAMAAAAMAARGGGHPSTTAQLWQWLHPSYHHLRLRPFWHKIDGGRFFLSEISFFLPP